MSRAGLAVWIGGAFALALALAAAAFLHAGLGKAGAELGLRLTARLAFACFWQSYVAGALVTLFGEAFRPLKARAAALGLAFAAVLAVHLGLVAWLCLIGQPPAAWVFLVFGPGALAAALLALGSLPRLARIMGPKSWRTVWTLGTTYIAFDFALDFLRPLQSVTPLHLAEYLPFAALAVLGPALKLLAWLDLQAAAPGRGAPAR